MVFGNGETSRGPGTRGKLAALLIGAVVAVGVTGCGSSAPSSAGTVDPSVDSTPTSAESASTQSASSSDASRAALRTYVNKVRPYLKSEAKRYSDVYKKFTLEAQGSSTMIYRYTFRKQLDATTAGSKLASNATILEPIARETILPEMENAGISNPVVEWTYQNADGTELKSFRFTSPK